jgi:hypothetical protein
MTELSEEIRSLAMAGGAEMVGFAPVERSSAGPVQTRPAYYMAQAPKPIERFQDRTGCRYLPREGGS